jgi:hypothetical protein
VRRQTAEVPLFPGLYGLVEGTAELNPLLAGTGFRCIVFANAYAALPAMRLYDPPWEYDAETLGIDRSYHVVYGVTTALAFRLLKPAAELERPGRPEHRRQDDARHGDGEADDPGGDVLGPHDRRRGDADPDDPAGRDHPNEHRFDAASGPRPAVQERGGGRIELSALVRCRRPLRFGLER